MKLYQAAHIIQQIFKQELSFIEFEDGSEVKFNYRLKGSNKTHFINLTNIHYGDMSKINEVVDKYYQLQNAMSRM